MNMYDAIALAITIGEDVHQHNDPRYRITGIRYDLTHGAWVVDVTHITGSTFSVAAWNAGVTALLDAKFTAMLAPAEDADRPPVVH